MNTSIGPATRAAIAAAVNTDAAALMATRSGTDHQVARELADHPDWKVRAGVLRFTTDPAVFQRLLHDDDPRVRGAAIDNDSLTDDELQALAEDPRHEPRCCVAASSRTPPYVLQMLAVDPSSTVRWNVAFHHSTNIPVLELMRDDPDEEVRGSVRHSLGLAQAHDHEPPRPG